MNGFINVNSDTLSSLKKYQFNNIYENNIKFTSIIILTYNQLNYTKLCIESIRKFTPKDSYEIIVVDNGSTDNTVAWLKKQADLNVIYNDFNNGFPAGCNQGIKIAKGDSILLLNNDTIVTPKWLDSLNEALYSSDDVGAVGAISNSCSNYQQINVDYKNLNKLFAFAKEINVSNKDSWDMRVKLIGFCYLVKKDVINKIGVLDEIFSPGNYEDDDFSFRILEGGYKLLLCRDCFIHHFGSVSFNQNPQFHSVFFANQAKMKKKWGFDSSQHSNLRLDLINLITPNVNDNINVLDIGCGMGCTLLQIKNQFRNANIYGVETDKKPASLINKFLPIELVPSYENLSLSYEKEFFDYLILGDIIEHLINPLEFLIYLKQFLKPQGYIICSIPNVMNISIIKNLILGRFKYEDSGLLDKNHLRFFTLTEIDQLFKDCNLEIETIAANSVPISPEDENLINILCSVGSESLKQQYLAYQYILRIKNRFDTSSMNPEDLKNLKFKLLRLDNDIDIEKSLEEIIKIYLNNKDSFSSIFKQLLSAHIINKEKVLNIIKEYSKSNNYMDLYNDLEVI